MGAAVTLNVLSSSAAITPATLAKSKLAPVNSCDTLHSGAS